MIYAGSEFHLLSELFVQGHDPFYQSASMMHLNPIDKKEYFYLQKKSLEIPVKLSLKKSSIAFIRDFWLHLVYSINIKQALFSNSRG